jgi:TRAP-type C4-dicarboxylate transport system substrate-binding protein
MTDMKIAPFVGGIVFSQRAWQRIPEELRPELRAAVERIAGELDEELAALEAEALREMEKRGLERHSVPPDAREEWEKRFETAIDWASGNVYDESFVDLIMTHLEEYRQRK